MRLKNTLAGIISIHYLFIDELELFSVFNGQVLLRKKAGNDWRSIPTTYMQSDIDSSPSTDNTDEIKHKLTVRFYQYMISDSQLKILQTINTRGCIVRITKTNQEKLIIGSTEHPIYGPVITIIGRQVKDASGYELKLTGTTPHPPLPYNEL